MDNIESTGKNMQIQSQTRRRNLHIGWQSMNARTMQLPNAKIKNARKVTHFECRCRMRYVWPHLDCFGAAPWNHTVMVLILLFVVLIAAHSDIHKIICNSQCPHKATYFVLF